MQSVGTINPNSLSLSSSMQFDAVANFFQNSDLMHHLHDFLDVESKACLYTASSTFRRVWTRIIDLSSIEARFKLMIRLWCVNLWKLAHRLILGVELVNVELTASILQPDKLRLFSLPSNVFFRPIGYLETLRQLKLYCVTCGITKKEEIAVMETSVANLIANCRQEIQKKLHEFLVENDFGYFSEFSGEIKWSQKAINIISSTINRLFICRFEFLLESNAISSYFYLHGFKYGNVSFDAPLGNIPTTQKKTIQQWYAMATNYFLEFPPTFLRSLFRNDDFSNAANILTNLLYRTSLRDYYSLQDFFGGERLPSPFVLARQVFAFLTDMSITDGNIIVYMKIFTGWLLQQCLPPYGYKPQADDGSVLLLIRIVLRYTLTETRVRLLQIVLPIISLYEIRHNYFFQDACDLEIEFLVFIFDSCDSIDRKLFQATMDIWKVVDFIKIAEERDNSRDLITEIAVKIILLRDEAHSDNFLTFELLWNLSTKRNQFTSTIPYYIFHERSFYFKKAIGFFRNLPGWVDAWLCNHARYESDTYAIEPNFMNRLAYSKWCERERQFHLSSKDEKSKRGVKRTSADMNG